MADEGAISCNRFGGTDYQLGAIQRVWQFGIAEAGVCTLGSRAGVWAPAG